MNYQLLPAPRLSKLQSIYSLHILLLFLCSKLERVHLGPSGLQLAVMKWNKIHHSKWIFCCSIFAYSRDKPPVSIWAIFFEKHEDRNGNDNLDQTCCIDPLLCWQTEPRHLPYIHVRVRTISLPRLAWGSYSKLSDRRKDMKRRERQERGREEMFSGC